MAVCTPDANFYTIEGRKYDRVTHILGSVFRKEGLERWRGRVGNEEADRIMETSAARGTRIHDACAGILERLDLAENPIPDVSHMAEDEAACVVQFLQWARARVSRVIAVERTVYSDRDGCAGTADAILRFGRDCFESVVDIKTGSKLRQETAIQTAAYESMARENGVIGAQPARRFAIRLDAKASEPEIKEYTDEEDAEAWMHTLSLYRWLTKRRRI